MPIVLPPEPGGNTEGNAADSTTISKEKSADFHMHFFRTDQGTFCYIKSPTIARYAKELSGGQIGDSFNITSDRPDGAVVTIPLYYIRSTLSDNNPLFCMSTSTYGKYLPFVMRSPKLAEGITFAWGTPIRVSKAREIADFVKQTALESIGEYIRPFSITVTISEATVQTYGAISET